MKKINKLFRMITWGTVAAMAGMTAKIVYNKSKIQKTGKSKKIRKNPENRVYFVGGGIGSMAGAAYLIRDCNLSGSQITIFEGRPILGGSNDGIGDSNIGFLCRGGRMLNEETYENFWELFRSIKSLNNPLKSVTEDILNFDHAHPTCARARLIDKKGNILNVKNMGFTQKERMALLRLMLTPEEQLDDRTIEEWFADTPHFFTTNFWYLWQTTFAFQTWSSLFEFRRYMRRMIIEFSRIDTLEGVTRTPFNQYESVIRPLEAYLRKNGVVFSENCIVTDIDFWDGEKIIAKTLHLNDHGVERKVELKNGDLCIMTNACMTDSTTLGDLNTPAPDPVGRPISGELWSKIAAKKRELGNPYPFFSDTQETNWESFTVTCRGNKLIKWLEEYSGNIPGSGALMTFRESSWLLSLVVAAQPHFSNQPLDQTVFWGYGLFTDRIGDYVKKPMKDCTGKEILIEMLHHLHMEEKMQEVLEDIINVIPCRMPYVNAQFQPRKMTDRPKVVPEGSVNFAMVSQFVEISDDMVFTEEYSVRAARIAVYTLMGVKKKICPVTPYWKDPRILMKALITAYRKES
ncbi:oleate hydratase [Clostridium sp. E02]|uniref:oleate hydratase n=1 Tax=Clostridium sp. E02 TaxID=2487134 RepID=UPI000F531AE2|nr:oleate hydratase [Clostridium sp. E02]